MKPKKLSIIVIFVLVQCLFLVPGFAENNYVQVDDHDGTTMFIDTESVVYDKNTEKTDWETSIFFGKNAS